MTYTTNVKTRTLTGLEPVFVDDESMGSGDASKTAFYTNYYPIVDSTADSQVTTADIVVYVSGSPVTVASINPASGRVVLDAAPGDGLAVTCDYAYADMSEEAFTQAVADADALVEDLTGRVFTDANVKTDYFDGRGGTYTDFLLHSFPVQSITSVEVRNESQSSWGTKTLATGDGSNDDYWVYTEDGDSEIKFTIAPWMGHQNVRITYTHGYSSTPVLVVRLASCLAAVWIHLIQDAAWGIEEYRLVEQEVKFAEGTAHAQQIRRLREEIKWLLEMIGKEKFVNVISR